MEENGLTVKLTVTNAEKYQAVVVPIVFLKFPINITLLNFLKDLIKNYWMLEAVPRLHQHVCDKDFSAVEFLALPLMGQYLSLPHDDAAGVR